MATDPNKDLESSKELIRDINKNLKQIQDDYLKAIGEIGKKTSLLPKTWADVTKQIKDNLPIVSKLNELEKKYEAGKQKQVSSEQQLKLISQKKKDNEASISNIVKQQQDIEKNSVWYKSLGVLTSTEQAKKDALEAQKKQYIDVGRELKKQKNSTEESIEDEKKKNKELEKSINSHRAALLILNLTKQAMVALITLGETYDKTLQGFAHSLGVGRIEAEKYVPALNEAAQQIDALGASLKDSFENATALTNQFDLMATANLKEVNVQMLTLNKAFGIAIEDSAKFYSTLTQVGNASLSSQTYMTGVADAAAKAAGVPLGKVIKDVANISEGVRVIFRGNTEQLIKQAAEARKLGTSLESAAKSAESLLNFESSVAAELKLSALLGKNVDFNESRRLFFAGKTVEAEKAILTQLNKIGDINDLNYFQRKALVDVTGKSFEQLQKMQSQTKQQLDLDAKFPQFAAERLKYEEKLKKISGDELEQKKQAEEMQARDNIANARANVFLKQKEQILLNLSRAIQPFYRVLTKVSEKILGMVVYITDLTAKFSSAHPIISTVVVAIGALIVGVVGLTTALAALIATFVGFSAVGVEISGFLTSISGGIAAFGIASLEAVPIVLSIAAAIAATGFAAQGIAKLFESISTAAINVATGLKTISDIGFANLANAAAGITLMAKAVAKLGLALLVFPTSTLAGFATNLASVTNANVESLNKLSEIFKSASLTGGKLMIGIEDTAVASINKLSDLKGERDELKQVIVDSNNKLVKSVEKLTELMANGGIGVYLNGQKINDYLATTTYRSGGYGQSTAR